MRLPTSWFGKVTPRPRQQFVVVRNGIDRLTPPGPSAPLPGLLRIVHAGSIYHRRDPAALAVARFLGRPATHKTPRTKTKMSEQHHHRAELEIAFDPSHPAHVLT